MGSTIEVSKEEVLLGVKINSDLTFKEHVTCICSKANQKLHTLKRVSKYMHHILMKLFISSQSTCCPIVSGGIIVEVLITKSTTSMKGSFV